MAKAYPPATKKIQYVVDRATYVKFATVAAAMELTGGSAIEQAMRDWVEKHRKKAGVSP